MTVRFYSSRDSGAPTMNGNVGSMISILDACLVNGYGAASISSITQAAGVATVTTATPHGYNIVPSANILIAGASPAAYNGEFRCTITGTNTFTYAVPGGTASPATGTITCKKNGSGWTKSFSGTNASAYKQPAGSNGLYLSVADNGGVTANVATIKGFEVAYDASTGLNPFPSPSQNSGNGNMFVLKSATANSTAREWVLVCNGPLFHLLIDQAGDNSTCEGMTFGDITPYSTGDAFATLICGATTAAGTSGNFSQMSNALTNVATTCFLARSYTQIGSSITVSRFSDSPMSGGPTIMGTGTLPYPHPVDGGLYIGAIYIGEIATTCKRGLMGGVWCPSHSKPLGHFDSYTIASGEFSGRILLAVNVHSNGQALFEISDTW